MSSSKALFHVLLKSSSRGAANSRLLPCALNHKQIHTGRGPLLSPPPPPPTDPTMTPSSSEGDEGEVGTGTDTISKAMQSYIRRAKEHREFMDKEEKEFVFGRRHLANMMGKDPETFTQADINEAIRYLFPSGLFEPKARPIMRPPQEIYPKQKAAQFDMTGRPHHPFFYTAAPHFFYLMHEMVLKLNKMNASAGGLLVAEGGNTNVAFAGSVWLTKEEMEARLLEKLSDKQYQEWVSCMDRIAQHPEYEKELVFLKGYRKNVAARATKEDMAEVTLEPDGRKSCFVPVCMKKSARAEVKVTLPGTGRFNINGQGLEYFTMTQSKEVVITPLQLCGWLGKVDIDAYAVGGTESVEHQSYGGESARAGAIRWGIAHGIAALGADREKLRLAGLLVRDYRKRERNKCGHEGARAKWTWKKR